MNSICKKIIFSSDNFRLKGTLHLPAAPCPPVVVGSHGLFSSGNSPKQIALAQECNRYGIAFFRFDHRGCGESKDIFSDVTSLSARCNDLINAVKTLQAGDDVGKKTGLFGSSMGGAVCLASADRLDIDAIVTVAAPVRIGSTGEAAKAIEKSAYSNRPAPSFYKKDLPFDISDTLSNIRNILIFHGEADSVIPLSQALEIYQNVGNPKRLIIQEKGDHRISSKKHQEEFIREAVAWFKEGLL